MSHHARARDLLREALAQLQGLAQQPSESRALIDEITAFLGAPLASSGASAGWGPDLLGSVDFQALADNLPAMMAIVDKDHRYVFVNKAYQQLDVDIHDIVGRRIADVIGEGIYAMLAPRLDRALAGEPQHFESHLDSPGAERRYFSSRYAPIPGQHPGAPLVLALITDVTDGTTAKIALEASERRYRLFTDHVPGLYSVVTPQHTYRYANLAYARAFGQPRRDIIGRHMSQVIGSLYPLVAPGIDRALAGEPQHIQIDHGGRSLLGHLVPSYGAGGEVDGVLALITDLTTLRQAQGDLARSRTALEVDHRVLRAFLQSDDQAACGRAAQVIAGALGSPMAALGILDDTGEIAFLGAHGCQPTQIDDLPEGLWQSVMDGERPIGQVRVAGREGGYEAADASRLAHIAATLAPILKARGERARAEAARQDLQQQLFQAQKMEAVGRLAGGIAHDFNNLLQVILGYAGLVVDTLPPGAESIQDMAEVVQAGERARDLVQQLLAFGRHDQPDRRAVELDAVIEQASRMVRRVIGADIDLQLQLDAPGQRVQANAGQLEQVLMNLCVNARDAMSEGGALRVLTRRCTLDSSFVSGRPWARAGQFIQLSVIDDGPGLDAAVIDHIFEPFFTTKQVGEGTGLGLAMVYAILAEHAGLIHASNQPGGGARFDLYLPIHDGEEAEPAPRVLKEDEGSGGEGLILLAEDNDGVRRFASTVLTAAGFTVIAAVDGADALRQGQDLPIRLAVLDVVMPHMLGPEVALRLRQTRPDLPILFMTGFDQHMVERYRERLQHFGQLHKPFTAAVLRARVHALLNAGAALSR